MGRILVVEDDENLNRVVCGYLKSSGFEEADCLDAQAADEELYNGFFNMIDSKKHIFPGFIRGIPPMQRGKTDWDWRL